MRFCFDDAFDLDQRFSAIDGLSSLPCDVKYVGSRVIYVELKQLIFKKQVEWGRTITVTEIADASGISRMTLHRMLKDPTYNASTDHLSKLCMYFQCELSALLRWEPDTPTRQADAA